MLFSPFVFSSSKYDGGLKKKKKETEREIFIRKYLYQIYTGI